MRLVLVTLIAVYAATPVLAAGEGGGHRFPPFDSSTYAGQLFWLFVVFGALYVLMSKLALPRIAGILEERQTTIDSALASAQAAQKSSESEAAALEAALAKARAKSQAIASEARAKSVKEIDATRAVMEKDLAAKLGAAEARIAETKAKAMANVDGIAMDAAAAIIEQLGGKTSAADIAKAIGAVRG